MSDEASRKPVKVGVHEGAGPPPGYAWNVDILDQAYCEAMDFLSEAQYAHLAKQVKELAKEEVPTQSSTIDVRSVEDFYELRDKGGILRRLNVRVFFFVHKARRSIVILGAANKQNDGPTPTHILILMRRRKRLYLEQAS
jgi:hypothetical protein